MSPFLIVFGILTSATVFAGVFIPVWAVLRFPVDHEAPMHRRIARSMGVDRGTLFENPALARPMGLFLTVAMRINWHGLRERIRRDLNAAGNPVGYSVDQYVALCLAASAFAACAAGLFDWVLMNATGLLFSVPFFTVIGFCIPLYALSGSARARVTRIAKQVPYTLDLVALVIAAGSSFTEAVETLIRDDPADDLNQELAIVLSEIQFGATRAAALANMADRIPLETLRSVVGAINQADQLGTPLAAILQTQAGMIRMHRSVRAEKLAASAGLRILVPTMLILIAIVALILVPFFLSAAANGKFF